MLSGQVKMYPQEYYLRMFKTINNLMVPNKLYNARSIHALIRDSKYSIVQVRVMLNYARNNNLIHYDSNFTTNIIYWKKNEN